MSTSSNRHVLWLDSPAELLALVPYVIGYHPTSSLVVVALADQRVLVVARLDLPTTDEETQEVLASVHRAADVASEEGATAAILIGYGPDDLVRPCIEAITDLLTPRSLPVIEALRVADGRYWSYRCDNPACCPLEGAPFDPSTSAAAATATAAGMVALPDRAAVADRLAPVTGDARDAMTRATGAAMHAIIDVVETFVPNAPEDEDTRATRLGVALLLVGLKSLILAEKFYEAGTPVDDVDAAILTVLLTLPSIRAAAARRTTGQPWEIDMWVDLVRRAEPTLTAGPATILAVSALHAGDGTLANLAADRALQADPTDNLTNQIATAVAAGVDPRSVAALLIS
ncbi:DUF4192 domain-containing protein [Virgisporangium aurantiacum]|uniref:DUF4192 domain-containing protein n=1 Tax=Virgisporangium aurantiacum TaxID=175570 RepID=A0A8J3ZHN6_9ACTN|nr:DUF4192 domain-containing protein [Virgisporangium aurantiacum]GIJ64369.1 hypothetical protein Vau01_118850 [Virgisporangium aurantiacum]